jgi:hypothetical protein
MEIERKVQKGQIKMDLPEDAAVEHNDKERSPDRSIEVRDDRDQMVIVGLPDYNAEPIKVELEFGELEVELQLRSMEDDQPAGEESEEEERVEPESGNTP